MAKKTLRINYDEQRSREYPPEHLCDGIDQIEIALGDTQWFGLGSLRKQHLDLSKLSIPLSALISADPITPGLGQTGFLGVLEPFWFNAKGFGIYIETEQLISFSFNSPTDSAIGDSQRPYLAQHLNTDGLLRIFGNNLSIRIFRYSNAKEVAKAYFKVVGVTPPPPVELLSKPMWTTWANFKNDINQEKVTDYARKIKDNGYECSVLGIDAKWQKEFGDTEFDPDKFPEPDKLAKVIHDLGFELTLWNVPFFNKASANFSRAIADNVVLTNIKDNSPYLGKWWEGEALFLDLTNPEAVEWHFRNLSSLAEKYGIDGFKFDAGEAGFYTDPSLIGHRTVLPQSAGSNYIKQIASTYPWSDTRTAWRTQKERVLLRQWDKSTKWGPDNGLLSCITQSIALNLLGYRFNFPDMIGGNEYGEEKADAELMIRWTQAVCTFPVIQYSIPPWRFGEECSEICLRYMHLHKTLAPLHLKQANTNEPLVAPLWWIAPDDEDAYLIEDQFIVCGNLLVAPVVEKGARERNIYLPAGMWRNYWQKNQLLKGPVILEGYSANLDQLPLFELSSAGQ